MKLPYLNKSFLSKNKKLLQSYNTVMRKVICRWLNKNNRTSKDNKHAYVL